MADPVWKETTLGPWAVKKYPPTKDDPVYFEVSVPSSKSDTMYAVVVTVDKITCDCPSFEYRSYCRHSREVKTYIDAKLMEKRGRNT